MSFLIDIWCGGHKSDQDLDAPNSGSDSNDLSLQLNARGLPEKQFGTVSGSHTHVLYNNAYTGDWKFCDHIDFRTAVAIFLLSLAPVLSGTAFSLCQFLKCTACRKDSM